MSFELHSKSYTNGSILPETPGHSHEHGGHGHPHEAMENAGSFHSRQLPLKRNFAERAFTVGIGGPVGSGKTALLYQLCKKLFDVLTSDTPR